MRINTKYFDVMIKMRHIYHLVMPCKFYVNMLICRNLTLYLFGALKLVQEERMRFQKFRKTLSDGHVTTKSLSMIIRKPANTNFMNMHITKDKVENTSEIKVHSVALTSG
jgi:hypothetical protein